MIRLLFTIFIVLLVVPPAQAERFAPKSALPYGITDIGGCKILSPRKSEKPKQELVDWCQSRPIPSGVDQLSWYDYHSSLELILGDALLTAERAIGGSRYSLLDRNTQLVLYNDPYPNAWISADKNEIVLGINDGLVNSIEATVGGVLMEVIAASNPGGVTGVTLQDWLEQMRIPRWGLEKHQFRVGPDEAQPSKYFGPAWFWETRIDASLLYEFVFSHELAHLKAGDRGKVVSLQLESKRDLDAFRAMHSSEGGNRYIDRAAILIPSFLLAMWYQERYWHTEIIESGIPVYEGGSLIPHARNWKERGRYILNDWMKSRTQMRKTEKKLVYESMKHLYSLRDPLKNDRFSRAAMKSVKVIERGVSFHNDPANPKVAYRYELENQSKKKVFLLFEIQSRYFSHNDTDYSKHQPFDHRARKPYRVFADAEHELALAPGESKTISGTLAYYGDKLRYPGIRPYIVTAFFK